MTASRAGPDGGGPKGPEGPKKLGGLEVSIVGAGPVGSAFALELARAGATVRIWSRTAARRNRLARILREAGVAARRVAVASTLEEAGRAEVCLLCIPDDALCETARALRDGARPRKSVALTTSGYHGGRPLQAMRKAGVATGSLHPLLPLPPATARGRAVVEEAAACLRGAWFATSGDKKARTVARRLLAALGGRELRLRDSRTSQATYHAAAALASNGCVALFDVALGLLARASDDRSAPEALASLLEATAANIRRHGVPDALTGPVARGDSDVVAGHLARLGRGPAAELYRLLGRRMVAMAASRGSLDAGTRRALEALLED